MHCISIDSSKTASSLISLDDLREAQREETIVLLARLNAKSHLYSSSDDEDNSTIFILEMLDKKQISEIIEDSDDKMGLIVFGAQLQFPKMVCLICLQLLFL